jgi:chromosome partitioning protein
VLFLPPWQSLVSCRLNLQGSIVNTALRLKACTFRAVQTIALYNLKGGVGKTAAAVNLAWLAADSGYRTLVVDLDPQGASSFYLRSEAAQKSSSKLFRGKLSVDLAVQDTPFDKLDIIPADLSARKLDLVLEAVGGTDKVLRKLLKELDYAYDFVFLDCSPGFSLLADNVFKAADLILMPVIPTTLSVRTYRQVRGYLEAEGQIDKLACFFSMVDKRKAMHQDVIEELLEDLRFFEHYIPYLSDIEKMGVKQSPLGAFAPSCYGMTCFKALWAEILEGIES